MRPSPLPGIVCERFYRVYPVGTGSGAIHPGIAPRSSQWYHACFSNRFPVFVTRRCKMVNDRARSVAVARAGAASCQFGGQRAQCQQHLLRAETMARKRGHLQPAVLLDPIVPCPACCRTPPLPGSVFWRFITIKPTRGNNSRIIGFQHTSVCRRKPK